MSDLEHLIENAVIAVEEGTKFEDFQTAERTKMLLAATDIFIYDVWEIAQYAVTTLKQDWKAKWEEDLKKNAGFHSPSEIYTQSCGIHADSAVSHAPQLIFDGEPIKFHHQMVKRNSSENTSSQVACIEPKEIYRGKTDSTGEWVYGSLIEYPDGDKYICVPTAVPWALDKYKVIPETVGGWTGLRDVNKKPIFEGDVIRHYDRLVGDSEYDHYEIGLIVWNPSEARYEQRRKNGRVYHLGACCRYEVTGKIYDDNHEMLGCDTI